MIQITRTAETRLDEIAQKRAEQYDSHILHNTIHDGLPEDDRLRHVADIMARAYVLEGESADQRDEFGDAHDRVRRVALSCGDGLSNELESLADVVEEELLERAAQNLSHERYDDDEVELAKEEIFGAAMEVR